MSTQKIDISAAVKQMQMQMVTLYLLLDYVLCINGAVMQIFEVFTHCVLKTYTRLLLIKALSLLCTVCFIKHTDSCTFGFYLALYCYHT